jgi:hypothetical protein
MALKGFANLKIQLDDETPALKDISAYVTTINGWTKEQLLEELTSAGDADERWGCVGIGKVEPVVLTGPYDNAADSLWDVTHTTWTQIRTLTITFDMAGAADVQSIETYIRSVDIKPERGKLHAVVVTLQPTGAVT